MIQFYQKNITEAKLNNFSQERERERERVNKSDIMSYQDSNSGTSKSVCPSDRQLQLRAK